MLVRRLLGHFARCVGGFDFGGQTVLLGYLDVEQIAGGALDPQRHELRFVVGASDFQPGEGGGGTAEGPLALLRQLDLDDGGASGCFSGLWFGRESE